MHGAMIRMEDHHTFLQTIGFDRIDDIAYVTLARDGSRIDWCGVHGTDADGHAYKVTYDGNAIRWYRDNMCHRDGDLPAMIFADSTQFWYKDGERHRVGDLPATIFANGRKERWVNGRFIRCITSKNEPH
jgi:hypothetical protein